MYAPLTITDLGSPMEHKTSPDHLSPDEFASMMEEFDCSGLVTPDTHSGENITREKCLITTTVACMIGAGQLLRSPPIAAFPGAIQVQARLGNLQFGRMKWQV